MTAMRHLCQCLPWLLVPLSSIQVVSAFLPSNRLTLPSLVPSLPSLHPLPSSSSSIHHHHYRTSPLHSTPQSQSAITNFIEYESPRTLIQKGMKSFRDYNDVPSSLDYFNRADNAVPDGSLKPYLWQRGISYYYLDLFREGSDQFRLDVSVNPLDVEEIVWDIACLARMDPASFPPPTRMALPKGKTDRRRIMSTVYSLFRGDGTTEYDLVEAGHKGNISDEFYSLFYLGLYCEIRNETSKAEKYMKLAASSAYATGPGAGDYMTSCARVHCKLRGWVV